MIYASMAGYFMVGASGLVLGTLFGSKVTSSMMSMVHGLEARMLKMEGTASFGGAAVVSGRERHAAAIDAHAAAVSKLADAIGKHAAAVDEHGAATVAAAVETHAATIAAAVTAGKAL